jgi:phytol kinase
VLVMAFGDGLAGLLGPLIPSPSWFVLGERRSLAGTATMAVTSMLLLLLLATLAGTSAPAPGALTLIAFVATALEQLSFLGVDNLTVPLAASGLWAWFTLGPQG